VTHTSVAEIAATNVATIAAASLCATPTTSSERLAQLIEEASFAMAEQ
jgi:hypothetical protein